MQLLWWGNLLDHDTAGRDVSGVSVRTAFVSMTAVSNHQSNAHSSFADPLTITSDLTMLVNVGVCSAVVCMDNINRFYGDWFGTFHMIEGKIPAFAALYAAANPEIAVKLDLQSCVVLNTDTILQKQTKAMKR